MGQLAGLILELDLLARSANWCVTCSFWRAFMCVFVYVCTRACCGVIGSYWCVCISASASLRDCMSVYVTPYDFCHTFA